MPPCSRRALLAGIAGNLSILAGCSGSDRTATSTRTDGTTSTVTSTSTPSATSTLTDTPTDTPTEPPRDVECYRQWDPRVRWSFSTDTRAHRPTVADSTVYFASQDGHLYALDASRGRVTWQVARETAWGVAPAVNDGIVTYKGYKEAAAYVAGTGSKRWSFEPPGNRVSLGGEFGDDGDAVYFGATNHSSTEISVENPYDRVYALDRQSGEQLWTTTFSESRDKHLPPGSVTAAEGRVFVTAGDHEGYLVALDASDGEELWRYSIASFLGPPVVADGTVYHNLKNTIVALDAATGEVRWTSWGEQPPGVGDGWVYCPKDGILRAYAATNGHTRWKAEIPDDGCGGRPRRVGDLLYLPTDCFSGNGRLYAFDAERGCRVGSFEVRSAHPTPPAIAGGTLFTGGLNGEGKMWAVSTS